MHIILVCRSFWLTLQITHLYDEVPSKGRVLGANAAALGLAFSSWWGTKFEP
jgi:hypothetical protein